MTFFDAIILGIVEGVTEFLPVSSTGHLVLASHLLGIDNEGFIKTFEIAIQLGAIGAVGCLYWRKFFLEWEIMKRIVVAFIPTGIIGFFLYGFVKTWLGSPLVVVGALFVGGILLIVFEKWHQEKDTAKEDLSIMSYKTAVLLGIFQALALVPGVSRSGATILGGLLLGFKRTAIVEFSFLLAVPTMLVATGYDLCKYGNAFVVAEWHLLFVGFVTAFFVALVAVKVFVGFIKRHTFIPFGIYRIGIAILFFFFVL
ncbi:MAG: undecaprenyl-diphosphatase UppP [Candidatus Moranbacteria bacterium]|nr:undecaprenyl-diphosphatase UppP [Candidatus Moranbacteria bacterium]